MWSQSVLPRGKTDLLSIVIPGDLITSRRNSNSPLKFYSDLRMSHSPLVCNMQLGH